MHNDSPRKIVAKFPGRCGCGLAIAAGSEIVWFPGRTRNKVAHVDCARVASLPGRMFQAGMLAGRNGGADEIQYTELAARYEGEMHLLAARILAAGGELPEDVAHVLASNDPHHYARTMGYWRSIGCAPRYQPQAPEAPAAAAA